MSDNEVIIQSAYNWMLDNIEQRLEKTGLNMVADAKDKLSENNMYATGQIVKGIKHSVTRTARSIFLEFGNYAKSSTGYPYPAVVEYGRKPGLTPPPSSVIEEWLFNKMRTGQMYIRDLGALKKDRKKTGIKDQLKAKSVIITQDVRGLAYIIAKGIGLKGIKGRPVMKLAFDDGVKEFLNGN